MTLNLPKTRRKSVLKDDRVPKRIRAAAEEYGWQVYIINPFWTRLRKDRVSIEFKYNLRRETRGRAYLFDVCLTHVFYNQHDIVEFMNKS